MAEETNKTAEPAAEAEAVEVKEPETENGKQEKTPKKDLEIEKLQAELEKKNDLLLRTAAEFDNYKKRTEREKTGIAEYARAGIIKKLLPIIDNVERSKGADKESPDYLKGVELIIKQFESLEESLEITEIAKPGDKFDPNFHEAVMHIEDENLGENEIAEVLQKGYKTGDTVIRAAMVKVAN